jgi:hypothetical protein
MAAQASALGAAWKVYQEFRKAGDELGDSGDGAAPGRTPEEAQAAVRARMAAAQEAILPHVIEALWNASILDIQTTIRHAVSKLLHDAAVTKEARFSRALALKRLGAIFQVRQRAASRAGRQRPPRRRVRALCAHAAPRAGVRREARKGAR